MGKRPTFKATKDPRKGWRVNVPAPFTASGKREQRFFRNRDQANEFAQPLRAMYREVGTQRRIMPLVDSDDAAAALVLLKPVESTLRDAARFYLKHHDRRSKAPTVGRAIKDGIAHRKGLSAVYLSNLRQMERRLPDSFKAMNLADVDSEHVKKALDAKMKGATAWKDGLRMLSVLLQDQVKAGVLENNPCKGVVIPKSRDLEEISYYTVEQLKALFAACRPYSDGMDRDCKDCAVPFAFLAFAGLRPAELERLVWEDVSVENENIRLRKAVTKTNKTRNVPINGTLMAWIQTVPLECRVGSVIPARWRRKARRVRKEAGLDGRKLQDALRHSYGSYSLAMNQDMAALNAAMGHQHMATYFDHYHSALTREVASHYWKVLPATTGTENSGSV